MILNQFSFSLSVGFSAIRLQALDIEQGQVLTNDRGLGVARGDEFRETQCVEVESKVFEKIALIWVVAIT